MNPWKSSNAQVLFLPGLILLLAGLGIGTAFPGGPAGNPKRPAGGGPPVVLDPDHLEWEVLPTGVRVAVLQGDPDQPGPFTLRLDYPAGYRKGPHYHPGDAYVTVLSGSYHRGYGAVFDESKAVELHPGTFSVNPAGVSHYEWTTGPALIQVHADGPWTTVYVDPEDRPIDRPEESH